MLRRDVDLAWKQLGTCDWLHKHPYPPFGFPDSLRASRDEGSDAVWTIVDGNKRGARDKRTSYFAKVCNPILASLLQLSKLSLQSVLQTRHI
jgi:hypothetical protein